jgi:hypothetical protein
LELTNKAIDGLIRRAASCKAGIMNTQQAKGGKGRCLPASLLHVR